MVRDAYVEAARTLVEVVDGIRPDEWEQPGLGSWSVRVLVGHASRSLAVVGEYLDRPAPTIDLPRTIDYYIALVRGGLFSIDDITRRSEQAAAALGDAPAAALRALCERTLARIAEVPDAAPLTTIAGSMRLVDYLPTRTFEIGVHTLDIGEAVGRPVVLPPAVASANLHLIADLAMYPGRAEPLILAATGRRRLPADYSVIP